MTEQVHETAYLGATKEDVARRRIVIIGGGFGGLACARSLAGADVDVTLVDRRNYHLFQPLLYQVATAALSPADIAVPIRQVLAKAKNMHVVMAEVTDVDPAERRVILTNGVYLGYDQLVVATGSVYNYFNHPDWAKFAPAPKSISDARNIRARLLGAFEEAEICNQPERRAALLTIVVIGGGPTGVEIAGTISELAQHTLRGNFRRIDPTTAKVILIEAGPRLLPAFPDTLGAYAEQELHRLGVEVRLGDAVDCVDAEGVSVAGDWIAAKNVIWGAGIKAERGANWLGGTDDRLGRLPVEANLAVAGYDNVFALGDVALFLQDGKPLPALAQVAQQQGMHLGRALRRAGSPAPYRYRSKGDTAVIGRHAAVYVYGRHNLKGRLAWFLWSIVHVYLLIGFERRAIVMTQWVWRYFTFGRGARLID